MKYKAFLSFILFLLLYLHLAAAHAASQAFPDIVCDEPEFFFGAATNTQDIIHEFILSNEGSSPLYIRSVRTDCGCVASKLANDTLAPGENTALKIRLDLAKRSGPQFRRIIVESNDPDKPRMILAMAGEAIAPLEIIPDQIFFGNIHVSAAAQQTCEIKFSEGDQSYIHSASALSPFFVTELISLRPRRDYKINIRTVPPLPKGSLQTSLKVVTDHPRFKTLEIPVQCRVVGDIYSIPEEITVKSKDGAPVARTFLVYSGLKQKFKLLNVNVPVSGMEARIRTMSFANGYRVDLRNIVPSQELNGKNIVVETDCETAPTLNVPLRLQEKAP
jgi:hypothetical protein